MVEVNIPYANKIGRVCDIVQNHQVIKTYGNDTPYTGSGQNFYVKENLEPGRYTLYYMGYVQPTTAGIIVVDMIVDSAGNVKLGDQIKVGETTTLPIATEFYGDGKQKQEDIVSLATMKYVDPTTVEIYVQINSNIAENFNTQQLVFDIPGKYGYIQIIGSDPETGVKNGGVVNVNPFGSGKCYISNLSAVNNVPMVNVLQGIIHL